MGRDACRRLEPRAVGGARRPSARRPGDTDPLTLATAVLKGDATDDVVRDAVMLGVAACGPSCRRGPKSAGDAAARTARRWQRMAVASAKQSGRAVVPTVDRRESRKWWPGGHRSAPVLVEPARPRGGFRRRRATSPPRMRWPSGWTRGRLDGGEMRRRRRPGWTAAAAWRPALRARRRPAGRPGGVPGSGGGPWARWCRIRPLAKKSKDPDEARGVTADRRRAWDGGPLARPPRPAGAAPIRWPRSRSWASIRPPGKSAARCNRGCSRSATASCGPKRASGPPPPGDRRRQLRTAGARPVAAPAWHRRRSSSDLGQ